VSTTFAIRGIEINYETGEGYLNLASVNAGELLRELGLYNEDLTGEIRVRALRQRLEGARAVADRGRLGVIANRYVEFAQPAGRKAEYIDALEALCEQAGDLGIIIWF